MQRLDTPKILKRDTLNLSQNLNFSKLPTSLEKKKPNHGFHSLQINGYVAAKPPPHPDQKQPNLLRKTVKIGNSTKDSGWIQPPGQ